MTREQLEKKILNEISISNAMGLKVTQLRNGEVELTAPLSANKNHKATAFGGSIHTLLLLSCWGWLLNSLDEAGTYCEVVIQSGETTYDIPITGDIIARSKGPEPDHWQWFLKMYERHRKGRLLISAEAFQDGKVAARFNGQFVAT